ncbi:Rrf2 family transcriptional regulator [Bdellovibrionota bacterium FG-2]
MISQTAEYALRAILFMAEESDRPRTTQQIAEATKAPAGYLSKVLQNLSKANLVNSQRGLGGGFTLTRPPNELTIYEIVQAVDPLPRILSCPLKRKDHGKNLCPLHRKLDDATALVEKSFREVTVAELISPQKK